MYIYLMVDEMYVSRCIHFRLISILSKNIISMFLIGSNAPGRKIASARGVGC